MSVGLLNIFLVLTNLSFSKCFWPVWVCWVIFVMFFATVLTLKWNNYSTSGNVFKMLGKNSFSSHVCLKKHGNRAWLRRCYRCKCVCVFTMPMLRFISRVGECYSNPLLPLHSPFIQLNCFHILLFSFISSLDYCYYGFSFCLDLFFPHWLKYLLLVLSLPSSAMSVFIFSVSNNSNSYTVSFLMERVF